MTDRRGQRQPTPRPYPVPPAGHETHRWPADTSTVSDTYRSTVPARLADLVFDLPADLAADAEEAAVELTRFDSRGSASPMIAALLRLEAHASSRIEGLTATPRELALAELGRGTSAEAGLVAANVRALETALRLADDIGEQAILATHRELLGDQPGWAGLAGRYREQPVWVGHPGSTPLSADFVPPRHALVPAAMADLVAFVEREDMQVVVQAAIAHAMFETVHPFVDGNGRVGRALVAAMLRAKGLMRNTTAPVSTGLLRDVSGYVDALEDFRAGDARPIVELFSEASRFAALSAADPVDQFTAQLEQDREALLSARLRPQAVAWRVLPHLVAQPVLDAHHLQQRFGMAGRTAQRALAQLTDAGVLTECTGLRRNRVWEHGGILAVLDGYPAGTSAAVLRPGDLRRNHGSPS